MTLQELMAYYDETNTAWEEKKAELEQAARRRSEVVKQIAEAIAPKKRVIRHGRELTVVQRGETYFFKGNSKSSDAVEVD